MPSEMLNLHGSHYDIGAQHGERLADVILNSVIPFVDDNMKKLNMRTDGIRRITAKYETLIEKQFPEIIEETRGLADGAGISYERALALLLYWEVRDTVEYAFPECSSFVASGDATADGKPIASQNSDWPKHMIDLGIGYCFHVKPDGQYSFIGRGLAGNLGRPSVIGFNEKGLAFVGSGIRQLKGAGFGFPPLTITRIGIERCSSVDEFLELLGTIPSWSHAGENVDVVDKDGCMARISFSTKRLFISQTKNHFVASTNHYHNNEMTQFGPLTREGYPSSWARYERLVELLWQNYGELDATRAQVIMSDHMYGDVPPNGALSLCRHGEDIQTLTNLILLPGKRELRMSYGTPCKMTYSSYKL